MQIDRRITNGLAWAGAILVVGILTADLLSAQFLNGPSAATAQIAVIEPTVSPVPAPAAQRPAAPAVAATVEKPVAPVVLKPAVAPTKTADVVDAYLQSGKPLPSYLTDGAAAKPVAARPVIVTPAAPVDTAPAEADPVQVASIPAKIAPVPMPLSMRPAPVTMMPVAVVPSPEPLVIWPANAAPLPPANVTAQDLEDWETGPLADFLARRQQQAEADPSYDADGFFLDEGPNQRRPKRDRLVGPDNTIFLPFFN